MRAVMLTFPRAVVPLASVKVRPLIGALIPRSMPGRSLIAQFLIGLIDTTELTDDPNLADPDLAPVLSECTIGLLRQRLGHPNGITPSLVGPNRISGSSGYAGHGRPLPCCACSM
jgi:hypothetical protein